MKKKLLIILIVLFCGTAAYSETVIDVTGNITLLDIRYNIPRSDVYFSYYPFFKTGVGHEFSVNDNIRINIGGGIGDLGIMNPILYGKGECSFDLWKGEKLSCCLQTGLSSGVMGLLLFGLYLDQSVSLVLQSSSNKGFYGGLNLTISEVFIMYEAIYLSPGLVVGVKF